MSSDNNFHFGVVGEGPDATIAAFGSSVAMGIPQGEAKAWACQTCTFWNTESMGRFCSMCGSRRFVGSDADIVTQEQAAARPPMDRLEISVSESGDILGDSPLVFSPIPGEKGKIGSVKDMLGGRNSSHLGTKALEKSFSVFGLLDEEHVDEFAEEPAAKDCKQPALTAREFQMSFANWSISDQGAWTCGACTFVNTNSLHLQCEICGQNRPAKTSQNQCQKVMQDMMETSFRSGQHDFLKKQQEKIEEIEERVIAAERMKEIAALQADMLNGFGAEEEEELASESAPSAAVLAQKAKAQLAEDYLDELERARKQELEEQNQMEALLEDRRRRLGMERMSTERCLQGGPIQIDSQQSQVRAQEQLLSQWKQSYRKKESDIADIRRRQEDIMNKWQHGAL